MGTAMATETRTPVCDSALVERLRAGDESAYDELVRATAGPLLAVARRMLGREDDAQDAVQTAYLNAFRAMEGFDGRSQLGTWLHRITVNACLMKLRSARRKPERPVSDLLPRFLADGHHENPPGAWNPPPGDGIEAEETRALVRAKVEELPTDYRVVLLMRDVEGLSTDEAARALGISPDAVKARLHRARLALRTLLDPGMRSEDAE